MNEELADQIKEYLKNNLQIKVTKVRAYYESESDYFKFELLLDGDVISYDYT